MAARWILRSFTFTFVFVATLGVSLPTAHSVETSYFWVKLKAQDSFVRTMIANTGASIEVVQDEFVLATANLEELKSLEKLGVVLKAEPLKEFLAESRESQGPQDSQRKPLDFPSKDSEYHNYTEGTKALQALETEFPDLVRMGSIGMSGQDRDIWSLVVSEDVDHSAQKPALLILGGHHAREHLSVEIPLRFTKWILTEYKNGNARIRKLLVGRQLHVIPMVNPDGLEYDIEGGQYKSWRKNRRANRDGTFGVDLNRNYGFKWGTGGSSSSPSSDTYMGTSPFSEAETQAIKMYIENHDNISTLISFHTFSELVLYPWGHSSSPITVDRDFQVHKKMAEKMATWNNYKPMQSSGLYVASGDLTDWSYGQEKVISFTFELDPKNQFGGGGFYPGVAAIEQVLKKNIEPVLYALEYADNPYRVLEP